MTGFAFLTVPSDGVAQTIDTFSSHTVTGSFVAVARLASGTGNRRIPVVRRGTPVERTNCHVISVLPISTSGVGSHDQTLRERL